MPYGTLDRIDLTADSVDGSCGYCDYFCDATETVYFVVVGISLSIFGLSSITTVILLSSDFFFVSRSTELLPCPVLGILLSLFVSEMGVYSVTLLILVSDFVFYGLP